MTEAANRIQELEAALETTAKLLRDALDALQHCNEEKVELGRQVAELSKPVTVQELKKHGCQGLAAVASVAAVNCVIAARAAGKEERNG